MATIVDSIVGTTGKYATPSDWFAAGPANLTLNVSSVTGTGSTTSAIQLDAAASGTAGAYVGNVLTIAGETRLITAYNTTTKIATVGALNGGAATFTSAPASGVSYTIGPVIWRARLQKQKFTTELTMAGKTTDANSYFEITTDTGASFLDDPSLGTNPLRYDASKGAAIEIATANSTTCINCSVDYTRISKIQMAVLGSGTLTSAALYTNVVDHCTIDSVIIEGTSMNPSIAYPLRMYGASTISNSFIAQRNTSTAVNIAALRFGAKAVNCTFVSLNAKLAAGINTAGTAAQLTNCYVGNVTACEDGTAVATKTTCYSDSGSSGYSMAAYSSANFTSVASDGTHDFRLTPGSALINVGTAITAGATSINGLSRPVGAAYDIGAWEYNSNVADTTAPILSAPTASATTATSASGSVATNEAGGLLYFMASANATETATTVKAGGSTTVTATGAQNVVFTGLTANTTYYGHFLQRDAAGNDSTVANTTSFITPVVDNTAPTFAGGAVITPGTISQTTVAFSWSLASDNVSVAGYETSKDGGATWQNNGTGTSGQFTALSPGVTYQIAVRAYDAAGNRSAPLTLSMTTTAAPTTGSFKSLKLANNTGTPWAAGTAVAWEWHKARIGTQGTITYGGGTLDIDLTLTATGLPVGAGYLIAAVQGATMADDKPYYQAGTVA